MLHCLGLLCKYVLANFKSKRRTLKASEVRTEFIVRLYSAQVKYIYNKPHSSKKHSEATSGGFSIHLLCVPSCLPTPKLSCQSVQCYRARCFVWLLFQ